MSAVAPNSDLAKSVIRNKEPLPCLACVDVSNDPTEANHPTNRCGLWKSLTFNEKIGKVKCVYHPARGLMGDHTTEECRVGKAICTICKDGNQDRHHTWFCSS